jgi:hypothetical protein
MLPRMESSCTRFLSNIKVSKIFKKDFFVQGGPRSKSCFLTTSFCFKFSPQGSTDVFKTLPPWLTVLDIPYFADAYSCTARPIDLLTLLLKPIPRTQLVMILLSLLEVQFSPSNRIPYQNSARSSRHAGIIHCVDFSVR